MHAQRHAAEDTLIVQSLHGAHGLLKPQADAEDGQQVPEMASAAASAAVQVWCASFH